MYYPRYYLRHFVKWNKMIAENIDLTAILFYGRFLLEKFRLVTTSLNA